MTIASALTALNTDIQNARTAITSKGGTVTVDGGSSQLATDIGTITPLNGTTLSVTPTTSAQSFTPTSPYNAYTSVSAAAVTSSIDANISAGNIKSGVTILGVTGTYDGGGPSEKYGLTIDNILGDVSSYGAMRRGSNPSADLTFPNVEDIAGYAMYSLFAYNTNFERNVTFKDLTGLNSGYSLNTTFRGSGIKSIAFPELVYIYYGGSNSLEYCCADCTSLTSVSFPKLTGVVGSNALHYFCQNDTGLTSISFPELTTITGVSALSDFGYGCSNVTSVTFPKLTTVSGISGCSYLCYNMTKLPSITFPELTTVSARTAFSYAFSGCSMLTTATFPKLSSMTGASAFSNAFNNCKAVTDIYFPALTTNSFGSTNKNQFNNMMANTGNTTTHTIHFPSNLQSKISTLTGYPLFGGTSGYVVLSFDLTATS